MVGAGCELGYAGRQLARPPAQKNKQLQGYSAVCSPEYLTATNHDRLQDKQIGRPSANDSCWKEAMQPGAVGQDGIFAFDLSMDWDHVHRFSEA